MLKVPFFGQGQRIGLFGGSFNPAHRGHVMVASYALKHLQLDWIWWLVSPQNPLKDKTETGEYATRLAYTRRIAKHPRFVVTDLEHQISSKNTAQTLAALSGTFSQANFVWIMGADSFANLHHWHHWQDIAHHLPLAILARPGFSIRALNSPAALRFHDRRIASSAAAGLSKRVAPAWVFLAMPLRKESSSAIRKRRQPKSPA